MINEILRFTTNDIIYNMLLFIQLHFLCQAFSPRIILLSVSSLKARLNYAGLSDLKTQDEISMSFPSFCPIKIGLLLRITISENANSQWSMRTEAATPSKRFQSNPGGMELL